ncbi:hypothetical protein [Streptomyces sp. MI02-7b]|uniref:hypothetical protein n=1 Tax=Streptomyces sp. MI02-7b TaxID=462941 RepID=UPI0029A03E62|nr:hypothetical protein [Streptomyces sp. MI02-7b]MDX3076793.1 hypothetical protein [Streptomyces sp. MI02-7b]
MGDGGLTTWFGLAGAAILVVAVTHWLVRRGGGWKALLRRTRHEARLTVRAFTGPVRTEIRYRSGLRLLVRLLRDRDLWADAERAVAMAGDVDPTARPYGVLAGPDLLGVLVAAGTANGSPAPVPPEPWAADPADPLLWWISRGDVGGAGGAAAPLLVCAGTDGRHAVLLDLATGPTAVSVHGAPRTARAVLQALAAQLEVRLPAGTVAVSDGVHPRHPGRPADEIVDQPGVGFVVTAQAPSRPVPDDVRLLTLGPARGRVRLLAASPDGMLTVHGAPAVGRIDALPLARAVVKALNALPPHPASGGPGPDDEPPVQVAPVEHPDVLPAGVAAAPHDDLAEPDFTLGVTSETPPARAAVRTPSTAVADDGLDDLAEPTTSGIAGVSAAPPTP